MAKKRIFLFMVLYFIIFVAMSVSFTQYIPYLTALGYNEFQKSFIQSSMALATIFAQLFFGFLSDKYRTIKKIMIVTLIAFTVAAVFFYGFETSYFLFHVISFVLYGVFYQTTYMMQDNWVLESGDKVRALFSSIRAFGSIGWAIGSMLIPMFIERFGYMGAGIATIIFSSLTLPVVLLLPDAEKAKEEKEPITLKHLNELLARPAYVFAVLSTLFLYLVNALNMIGVIDKMITLGATATHIGLKWSLQAVVEIPIFFIGSWLLKKFDATKLMFVSALTFTLQFLGFAFTSSITVILALSTLQLITFPLMILSVKNIIFDLSPDHLKSSGQSIAMSICSGVSALATPIYIAFMIRNFNHTIMLLSGSVFGLLAMILIILLQKKQKQHYENAG